jgi:uncharacterized Zn-finger protein
MLFSIQKTTYCFLLNKFIFIQNNIISWSSHCAKYCCPGNWLNQQSCIADKLEHEEKYDGRIEELKIILSALPRRHLLPAAPEDSYGNHEFKQILKARFAEWREAFQVSPCTKSFNQNSDLVIHIRVHTGVKPFPCPLCRKAFSSSSSLCLHTRIHTGQKPFRCTLCEKSYSNSSDLRKYSRSHTGEKPFKCSVCEKSFRDSKYLKIHIRIHTGEKPCTCSLCGKAFSLPSHLREHSRVHTGEKPCVLIIAETIKLFRFAKNLFIGH